MKTVVIFGAGATKACGGPLTNEILPAAHEPNIEDRENFLKTVEHFLTDFFFLPPAGERRPQDYPPLPLLLSIVDMAIDLKHALGPMSRPDGLPSVWTPDILSTVRAGIDYAVFAVLESSLSVLRANPYADFLAKIRDQDGVLPTVISLNYDLIADNTMFHLEEQSSGRVPDYGCEIATEAYKIHLRGAQLLKIHGSLNWLYCPGCHRLDVGMSGSGMAFVKTRGFSKVMDELYREIQLGNWYGCTSKPCLTCGTPVRPVIVTPTQLKDYRNPYLARVWYLAENALREAQRAIFVGYGLPDDDLHVIYLLKRGLRHLDPRNITVVEYGGHSLDQSAVGKRYRALFSRDIQWFPDGFESYVTTLAETPKANASVM